MINMWQISHIQQYVRIFGAIESRMVIEMQSSHFINNLHYDKGGNSSEIHL